MDVPPRTVGRYEIRREIGRGMMGVVYEALDPALARTIALKTIEISFAVGTGETEAFEARFFAEAQIAARLSHPGIVVVHDVGRDAQTGTLYIAMEWLRGRTLADLIREGVSFEWRQALSIVLRIAEALHHAHTQGVIHRDLKPANLILLPSGEPKILDFGIAKAETSRIKVTSDGQSFGTPLYMSPEQALGKDLDARSDLFSLGAVAYNLLTGRAAFAAPTVLEIIRRVVEDTPVPPSQVLPGLPLEVDAMVGRALAKSRAARYPDGQSMAEHIKDILGGRQPHELVPMPSIDPVPAPASALVSSPLASLVAGIASAEPHAAPPAGSAAAPVASREAAFEAPGPADPAEDTAPAPKPAPPSEPEATPPPRLIEVGQATRPGGDFHAELETLVSGLEPLAAEQATRRSVPAPPGASASAPVPGAMPRAPSPRRRATLWTLGAAALFLGGAGITWLMWPHAEPVRAPPPRLAATAPPPTPTPAPPTPSPEVVEAAPDPPEPESPPPRGATARLAIDFEFPLKDGTLRLWVDDKLALDQDLTGRGERTLGIRLHKGSLEKTIAVRPGRRAVRVRVAWDDNVKEERLAATFRAGRTRRLEIRLGRIRKNLSLEWK